MDLNDKLVDVIGDIENLQLQVKNLKTENAILRNYIDDSITFTATMMNWDKERIRRLWNEFHKNYKKFKVNDVR